MTSPRNPTTCKFGGTSLAGPDELRAVADIVRRDPARRYIVPSAPGKRTPDDRKITDLLYLCHEAAEQGVAFGEAFDLVAERFRQIHAGLGLTLDLEPLLDETREGIAAAGRDGRGPDFAASRGEYLNGRLLADLLGVAFVDAAEVVRFDAKGQLDQPTTYAAMRERVATLDAAVVPGFYGSLPNGTIKTFSRGGSDISGALVAAGVGAGVYENWTDVSGLLMADPRIVDNPRAIGTLTYRELRELSYSGATVLHEDAVFPVREAGIPVNIRNTRRPDDEGTLIIGQSDTTGFAAGTITGIAGRRDFTAIHLEKAGMNRELGFGRRVLNVLETHGISFEHMPSGIDTLSLVVGDDQLDGKLDAVLASLRADCKPDDIVVDPDLALIATVGRGMASTPGMAARLFAALADAKVNIRMIDQGSSELNIIAGVNVGDFDTAVRAIYSAFVK